VHRAHQQTDYRVRFDWGVDGATTVTAGADVAVLVDVLSFTTTVSVALDRGIVVLPYRWQDGTAEVYARDQDAVLAVGRSQAAGGARLSLSPAAVRAHPDPPARLVLPSPNGSSIAHQLGASGVHCIGACLRNAAAVAAWLDRHGTDAQTVAVIAAGERWPGGGLRPAVEDAWGAGAVLTELRRLGWTDLSRKPSRSGPAMRACAAGRPTGWCGAPAAGNSPSAGSVPMSRSPPRSTRAGAYRSCVTSGSSMRGLGRDQADADPSMADLLRRTRRSLLRPAENDLIRSVMGRWTGCYTVWNYAKPGLP
jgi:2-phosphosulfolactate phosphatase